MFLGIGQAKVSKTLPDPISWVVLGAHHLTLLVCFMYSLSIAQALLDQIYVPLRGGYPAGGLLLERVQDVQDALKTHRVKFCRSKCHNIRSTNVRFRRILLQKSKIE
jgi:hypothetical protein